MNIPLGLKKIIGIALNRNDRMMNSFTVSKTLKISQTKINNIIYRTNKQVNMLLDAKPSNIFLKVGTPARLSPQMFVIEFMNSKEID